MRSRNENENGRKKSEGAVKTEVSETIEKLQAEFDTIFMDFIRMEVSSPDHETRRTRVKRLESDLKKAKNARLRVLKKAARETAAAYRSTNRAHRGLIASALRGLSRGEYDFARDVALWVANKDAGYTALADALKAVHEFHYSVMER